MSETIYILEEWVHWSRCPECNTIGAWHSVSDANKEMRRMCVLRNSQKRHEFTYQVWAVELHAEKAEAVFG